MTNSLWLLGLSNDRLVVAVICVCSELLNMIGSCIMNEIINLMNNTITLLAIIVVGGVGVLLEWVQICNLAGSWKRGQAVTRRAQGFESLAPPSFNSEIDHRMTAEEKQQIAVQIEAAYKQGVEEGRNQKNREWSRRNLFKFIRGLLILVVFGCISLGVFGSF